MMEEQGWSRRTAMAMLAAAPVAARAQMADPFSAGDEMRMLLQMRGALDDRLVVSFLEGVYYGVMDAQLTPIYGLSAGLFRRYFARPDGGVDYVNFELVYVTDLETGGLLKEFRNPYSGLVNAPPQSRLGPGRMTIQPDRQIVPAEGPGRATYYRCRPAHVVGDDVWIIEEAAAYVPAPLNYAFNEMLTYHAKLSDLADTKAARVPTTVSYTPVIGWRPWHGMADHPAANRSHITGVCSGRIGSSLDILPPRYLRWTEEFHPDVLRDPAAVLAGMPKK
jgi:hypothetical protein